MVEGHGKGLESAGEEANEKGIERTDSLNSTESRDNVDTVVRKLPELAVVTLRGPGEGVCIGRRESANAVDRTKQQPDALCLRSWYCFHSTLLRHPLS